MDFRCFSRLDLEVPPPGALLTGANAQGKTTILEAVCMLVRLQSPRCRRMPNLARHGSPLFGIAGDPWEAERQVRWSREGMALSIEGETLPNRAAYLEDGGLIVWMGNEDLQLIRGPGEGRRRFLDFIGTQIDPSYRRARNRYGRALKAKNLLLKETSPRDAEIRAYEELLVEHGTVLMETRRHMISELQPLVQSAHRLISRSAEDVAMQYLPASGSDLRESIQQSRKREQRTRQSVVGPHRDDLSLRIHRMPASEFGSEGQQRTLALALKLAQGKLLAAIGNRTPIYLLDDIFGELDPTRRNALMSNLPDDAQKWITTTHLNWLEGTDASKLARFSVHRGNCHIG